MKQQIQDIINQLEKLLDEPKPVKKGRWVPEAHKPYFFIGCDGVVADDVWLEHKVDEHRLSQNNIFQTREDAQTKLDIQNRITELTGDWVADFEDNDQRKAYLRYDPERGGFFRLVARTVQTQGVTYMPEHVANQILKEFTTEQLKLWAGV